MHILITEQNEIHPDAIELLKKKNQFIHFSANEIDKQNIEVVFIRTYTKVDQNFMDQFPRLKYILRAGVGIDNIDTEMCKQRNIQIINAPGSNANAVAEFVVGIIITALRHIPAQTQLLKENKWRQPEFIGSELKGKTLGLIGCGAIGQLITKKLTNFELKKIVGFDPFLNKDILKQHAIQKVELKNLLATADIISLHLPLTDRTHNLISMNELQMLRPNAIIINTSRGGIIHEQNLIEFLQQNLNITAILDVFENEPNINSQFLQLKNVIATPHIAGYTQEADKEMSLLPVKKFLEMIE